VGWGVAVPDADGDIVEGVEVLDFFLFPDIFLKDQREKEKDEETKEEIFTSSSLSLPFSLSLSSLSLILSLMGKKPSLRQWTSEHLLRLGVSVSGVVLEELLSGPGSKESTEQRLRGLIVSAKNPALASAHAHLADTFVLQFIDRRYNNSSSKQAEQQQQANFDVYQKPAADSLAYITPTYNTHHISIHSDAHTTSFIQALKADLFLFPFFFSFFFAATKNLKKGCSRLRRARNPSKPQQGTRNMWHWMHTS